MSPGRRRTAILASVGVGLLWLTLTLTLALVMVADRDQGSTPTCWVAATEDSDPHQVPCDYRNGAWWPRTPPLRLPTCDRDIPGAPVTGTCWLADDGSVAVWPRPYASGPVAILEGS